MANDPVDDADPKTGIDIEGHLAAVLFGKEIPIFVGGQALMGCRIYEVSDDELVSTFIVKPYKGTL